MKSLLGMAVGSGTLVYKATTDKWSTTFPSLPAAIGNFPLITLHRSAYVFSGWDGQHVLNTVYTYDATAGVWSARAPMPAALVWHSAVVMVDITYVLVCDGANASDVAQSPCYAYSSTAKVWTVA